MSKKKVEYETEIETPDQWEKILNNFEGILVVQLYSSNFGPVTCVGADVDIMMKKFKREKTEIRWRRLDVATLEDSKRHQRLENSREGDESKNNPDLLECDQLVKLEGWSQFNHPQPFFLFFHNGTLVDILRKVDAPKMKEVLTNLIKAEETPKPYEGEREIVIGPGIWDPEKERLEMEKAKNEALEAALSPLFQRYFCLYEPSNKISNQKQVEDFCKLLCSEEKDIETMKTKMLDAPTSTLSMKSVVFALNEIFPEDALDKLEPLRVHVQAIDPQALRKERVAYLTQMLRINTRGATTIMPEHVQLLKTRTQAELPEDFSNLKLEEVAEKLLSHLDLSQIWNSIRHGLTSLFQAEELKAILASLLIECDQAEPLGEDKTKELLTNILGEEYTLPEAIGDVFQLSPIQLAERLSDFDVITKEHLRKFQTKYDPSGIRSLLDMDILRQQLEQDTSEQAKVGENTLHITDASEVELALGIYYALLTPDVSSLTIEGYPEALTDILKTFGDKFTTMEFLSPPPAGFVELLPVTSISSLVIGCNGDEWIEFFNANVGESLKSIQIRCSEVETSEELQKALVNFVQQHDVSDFTNNWNFTEDNATALFEQASTFRNLGLEESHCINACLNKEGLQVNAHLHLRTPELLSEETFPKLIKFLEAKEEMIPHIHLEGACDVGVASWEKLFTLLKEKQGCEHLRFNSTNISTEGIILLANLLNENKHIGAVELTKVDPADVMELLSKLNTDRTFDLMFHFDDDILQNKDFKELAKQLTTENEWLCIQNIAW